MTANASTTQIDTEMNTTARTAAAYLQHRLYPQAAALGVVLRIAGTVAGQDQA